MKKFSFLRKALAAVLCTFILLSFASCKDTSWVVSSGNESVGAGVYLGYLVDAYYTAANSVTDTTKDMFSQKIGDVKVADYIKNSALENCKKHIVINTLFDEFKLSFSENEKKEFEESFKSIWNSVSYLYEDNGCGKESLKKILLNDEKYEKVFEHYYSKDGKSPVSEKERKEYFTKNYAKIKYISVDYSNHFSGVESSSKASDAQKKELKEIAEGYVARLEKGEDIDKLQDEEEKAAASTNKEEVEEHDHEHDHAFTFVPKDTSSDPDDFNKKIFASDYSKPILFENTTYGYYVFVRYKMDADSEDYTDRSGDVLSAMKSEDFGKIIDKEVEKIKVTENSAAINRYKPQNVTFE